MCCNLHLKKRRNQFKPQMTVLGKRILGCYVAFLNQIEETSPHMEELSDRTVHYLASQAGMSTESKTKHTSAS